MLVLMFFQERTLIGRPDAPRQQDIQLLGLGIMSEHCIVLVEGSDVFLEPLDGARYDKQSFRLLEPKMKQHNFKYFLHIQCDDNHFHCINHV